MIKTSITLATLMAASSYAYASGFYVDAGLSRDNIAGQYVHSIVSNRTFTIDNTIVTTQSGPNSFNRINSGIVGWDGFIGFGYNYAWRNQFSLGLEIYGDLSSAKGAQLSSDNINLINNSTSNNNATIRETRSLGVSLFPGYLIAPGSLYFLELGYVNSRYLINGFPVSSLPDQLGPILSAANVASVPRPEVYNTENAGINAAGFRLGFGTNTQIGTHLAVRQEYIWEFYANVATANNINKIEPAGIGLSAIPVFAINTNLRNTIAIHPRVGKYNLAAIYYFTPQSGAPDESIAPRQIGGHFYAGLNASYEKVSSEDYANVQSTISGNNEVILDNLASMNGRGEIAGANIGLLAGYGINFSNRWYAGIELFGDIDSADEEVSTSVSPLMLNFADGEQIILMPNINFISWFSKQWAFGAALIPGYQVSDYTLLYARVGYIGAQFKHSLQVTGGQAGLLNPLYITDAQRQFLANINSRSAWLNGLQLGIGVDTLINKNLSLRTEFDINNYGRFHNSILTASSLTVDSLQAITTVSGGSERLIEDQFKVALIWHFFD